MEKTELRNILFEKYFEVEDGILAKELVDKLSFISELWEKLRTLCKTNINYFNEFCTFGKFKLIEHKKKKYLILKLGMCEYVIIDIEKMENVSEEQFRSDFDEDFFVNNFDETKDDEDSFWLYDLINYDGNVEELVDFYNKNQSLLCLSTILYYRLDVGIAWTYFYIDFANANALLAFQTPDKLLYDQLYLSYDLTISGMQDAHEKIGIERMQEMFERIKELKIPIEVIPEDLYKQFLEECNRGNHKL